MKDKLYKIIFETDTKAGRLFDIFLLWIILVSVITVVVESVPSIGNSYPNVFYTIELLLTVIFTIEYIVRIWVSPKPVAYIFSIWGIIDFLSVLPTYLGIIIGGYHYLLVVRIFRLLRVFRILRLVQFNSEAKILVEALKSSRYKISVFFIAVLAIVVLLGTLMYVIEGGEKGFTSIPESIYWAIVTITTVGYGDLVPHTTLGKFLSSIAMIVGYAIIAVPTGIVTAELSKQNRNPKKCACGSNYEADFKFCPDCGNKF